MEIFEYAWINDNHTIYRCFYNIHFIISFSKYYARLIRALFATSSDETLVMPLPTISLYLTFL